MAVIVHSAEILRCVAHVVILERSEESRGQLHSRMTTAERSIYKVLVVTTYYDARILSIWRVRNSGRRGRRPLQSNRVTPRLWQSKQLPPYTVGVDVLGDP